MSGKKHGLWVITRACTQRGDLPARRRRVYCFRKQGETTSTVNSVAARATWRDSGERGFQTSEQVALFMSQRAVLVPGERGVPSIGVDMLVTVSIAVQALAVGASIVTLL